MIEANDYFKSPSRHSGSVENNDESLISYLKETLKVSTTIGTHFNL